MVLNARSGKLLYIVIDSNYNRGLFVLPARTVWVRNSLFIAVEDGLFSLMKILGKLHLLTVS